jgi:hypothetical protein
MVYGKYTNEKDTVRLKQVKMKHLSWKHRILKKQWKGLKCFKDSKKHRMHRHTVEKRNKWKETW